MANIVATKNVEISFVQFDIIEGNQAVVVISIDGEEYGLGTNRENPEIDDLPTEVRQIVEAAVAGSDFSRDNEQHVECYDYVAELLLVKASAYAEACWAMSGE